MKFNNYKAEEKTLGRLVDERYQELLKDKSLTFEDGVNVGYFLNMLILYFRCMKDRENDEKLSPYDKQILKIFDKTNNQYGFNISVKRVQENTIYTKEN